LKKLIPYFLLLLAFHFSCGKKRSSQPEVFERVAKYSITEYMDGVKTSYTEYSTDSLPLLIIYYYEGAEDELIYVYDKDGNILFQCKYTNHELQDSFAYQYEFDQQGREIKQSMTGYNKATGYTKTITNITTYETIGDTTLTVYYNGEDRYREKKWERKMYTDKKDRVLKVEHNPQYWGKGGHQLIYHYSTGEKYDYIVEKQNGESDTTFCFYNDDNKQIRSIHKRLDKTEIFLHEYDSEGHQIKTIMMSVMNGYEKDTTKTVWEQDWGNLY
jgi:hypothetical protein